MLLDLLATRLVDAVDVTTQGDYDDDAQFALRW